MTFEIIKNVPAPAGGGAGRQGRYPFARMVPQDAFFVPIGDDEDAETVATRVRGAAGAWVRRNHSRIRFAVRRAEHPTTKAPCVGVYAQAPRE